MKRKCRFATLLIAFLLSFIPLPTAFSTTTNLFIDPPKTTVLLGETFSINITVSNVPDLKGWELKLYYRSTLNATNITEGPFLQSGGNPTFFLIQELDAPFNSTHNRIWIASAILGNVSGVSGSGTLATITFNVTRDGNSTLHLSDTDLRDSTIVYSIPHTTTDGFVEFIHRHNLAVTNVTSRKISLTMVDINVTVENRGIEPESNINLSIYYDSNLIETKTIAYLEPAQNTTLNFKWNITHVESGNYTVSAHVTPVPGETYTTDNTYTDGIIQIIHPPVAHFEYTPTNPLVEEAVTFNATLSTPNGGTITSYFWDFGDGTNGTVAIATHAYTSYGNYTVTLTITDSEGLTDSESKQINVRQHPTANFTYSPSLPLINETVTFDASNSKPNGGTILTYTWDFGDGESGSGKTTNHTYSTRETFNVTLTVTDSEGLTDTIWKIIRIEVVHDVAVTSVTVSPNMTSAGRTVNITVTVNNLGEATETFDVKAYYDNNLIETKTVTLAEGENTTLTFAWNTDGIIPCHNYTIKAEASPVPYEIDTANNVYIDGKVKITMPGDVNGDGKVRVDDVFLAAEAFGTEPGHPRWNPDADVNGDGGVRVDDIFMVARNFGRTCTC